MANGDGGAVPSTIYSSRHRVAAKPSRGSVSTVVNGFTFARRASTIARMQGTDHEPRTTFRPAWRRWGPYVSERAWGTVREVYSADGEAWTSFPHDHARSRAYRWSEDGLGAICDDQQLLCFGFAFWNGKDPILKERISG